jgi:hypothetical protein
MTRVLLWKELREQWMSAVALVLLGASFLYGVGTFADPSGSVRNETAVALTVCLAWMCGLIAGAQPLAAEREACTLAWLDALPVTRRQLWWVKAGTAIAIVVLQVAVLLLLRRGLYDFEPLHGPVELLVSVTVSALSGLAGGMLGSALASTALGAIGWALVTQFLGWLGLGLLIVTFTLGRPYGPDGWTILGVLVALLLPLPFLVSRRAANVCQVITWSVLVLIAVASGPEWFEGSDLKIALGVLLIELLLIPLLTSRLVTLICQLLVCLGLAVTIAVTGMRIPLESILSNRTAIIVLSGLVSSVPVLLLLLSHRIFTRLDRLRIAGRPESVVESSNPRCVLLWLAWRQGGVLSLTVLAIGLVAILMLPGAGPLAWPLVGLILGVISGVGVFGTDQVGEAYRFLGDRRVPPGRVWLTKLVVRFAILAIVLTMFLLVGYSRVLALNVEVMSNDVNAYPEHLAQIIRLFGLSPVALGPVYGFAIGQFFGLICRKSVIAAVLSLLVGCVTWAAWMPSLTIGGVHVWQWLVLPLILFGATRLAVWPWFGGRLASLKPTLGLLSAGLLAVAGVAAGLWYRVAEVPITSDPFDVAAFEASLPTPEQNSAGRTIVWAIQQFGKHLDRANAESDPSAVQPVEKPPFQMALEAVSTGEWPAGAGNLDRWLDAVLQEDWLGSLRLAVKQPLGMVALGGRSYRTLDYRAHELFAMAGNLILARAQRHTSRGEVGPALDDITLAVNLSRHLRSEANGAQFASAVQVEQNALALLGVWAEKASQRPELLRKALDTLRAHEAGLPPLKDVIKTDYIMMLDYPRQSLFELQPQSEIERSFRQLAVQVPWEQVRTRGILATLYTGFLRTADTPYPEAIQRIEATRDDGRDQNRLLDGWTPPEGGAAGGRRARYRLDELMRSSIWWSAPSYDGPLLFGLSARNLTAIRAAQLQIALVQYATRIGKPADELAALVPEFLPTLPADPYGNGPFRYRLSAGEKVQWHSERPDGSAVRTVAPGQGVLWSVGPDLKDNGGQVNDVAGWPYPGWKPGGDILFLVPRVAKP